MSNPHLMSYTGDSDFTNNWNWHLSPVSTCYDQVGFSKYWPSLTGTPTGNGPAAPVFSAGVAVSSPA
jgi:hypothetical protein